MGDVPEQVFIDAARADAERYCAVSGAAGIDVEETARLMARDPALRTIAASAYRAGQAATPDVCDDKMADLSVGPNHYCTLPLGHRGWHREGDMKWREDAATPDGPRRWALPDEPGPEVTAVRGGSQTIYRRVGPHWQDGAHRVVESWWEILADGPLTDTAPAADGQDGGGRG